MCGIAGFTGGDWSDKDVAGSILKRMAASLRNRGPDHSGAWTDEDSQVALTSDRLAILDLSPAGHQPMQSHSGRFMFLYNGEIYNHLQVRSQIEAAGTCNWNGHSDTETLLAAIESWGVAGALQRVTGMFAFALWDKSERTLTLARDRLGEKPLYYGRQHKRGPFLFGSELKALAQHPQFRSDVDREALTLLLRYNYIPAPFSIYRGIRKLLPGTFLTVGPGEAEPRIEQYWSATKVAEAGVSAPLELGDREATDALEELLEQAVGRQMMADVPLGAFLSGGVDSSMIVAVMQKLSSRPVKTFTIGFHEKGYSEAGQAKAVARHLGTDHTEHYVTAGEALAYIPRLPEIYDEPFADSSQIPTYLLSALARKQVKVSLSGDGGDELFGGYNRYLYTALLWDRISAVPKPLRRAAARGLTAIPASAWTSLGHFAGPVTPRFARVNQLGNLVHKGALFLDSDCAADIYARAISVWGDPGSVVLGATEPANFATGESPALPGLGPVERMMALDLVGYLPGDILTKVDRAAMAVSLETRIPFLDHELVEFAWKLPLHMKIRDGQTKWILREVLCRHVPRALIDRPKMGFGIPLGEWLRGPLRDWAEALLDERRLRDEGYFQPEPIRRLWAAHVAGRQDWESQLWSVLMFQAWLDSGPHRTAGTAQ